MPIYSKTGDNGETSLYDGQRVRKGDVRVWLLGELDELNAYIGLLITYLKTWKDSAKLSNYNHKFLDFHLRFLEIVQSTIFEVGSEVANPNLKGREPADHASIVKRLEAAIDVMDNDLTKLQNFILPGGSAGAAYAHICRALTRRVERRYFSMAAGQEFNESTGKFLNRLSDYFFVLARFLNKQSRVEDIIWRG